VRKNCGRMLGFMGFLRGFCFILLMECEGCR